VPGFHADVVAFGHVDGVVELGPRGIGQSGTKFPNVDATLAVMGNAQL